MLKYYHNYCIDSNKILHNDKDHQVLFVGGPNVSQMNQRWRTATILQEIDKSPYLGNGLTDHNEIWHSDAD